MAYGSSSDEPKKPAITYWAKDPVICPCCEKKIQQEVMHQGGGRMIAGELTDELRRLYEPSKKFGSVYPLIYDIGCCPNCHCALFWRDLKEINDMDSIDRIRENEDARVAKVEAVFPHVNYKIEKGLYEGAAAYYMALLCYEDVSPAYGITFKRGQICLRLAWLCNDLESKCPGHNFNYMAEVFYRKALFFYQQTLINEQTKKESVEVINSFGPDTDKNYGYDGVIYLSGLLEYKYGQKENLELRLKKLDEAKRAIARIFGLGKSSKSKPGPLLETARRLYDGLAEELSSNNLFDDEDEE